MTSPTQYKPSPPRLMLYLEWIFLGIIAITTIIVAWLDVYPQFPFLAFSCLGLLGVLGLPIFKSRFPYNCWLTVAEFGLMLLPYATEERIPNSLILGALLVIRSAQRFNFLGRVVVAISAYVSHIFILFFLNEEPLFPLSFIFNVTHVIPRNPLNLLVLKFNAAIHYGMMLTFLFLLTNSFIAERQNRQRLSAALTQLRQYALRIEDQAALHERNRIAREIHDALGHTLTAQSVQLDGGLVLLKTAKSAQAVSFFNTAKALCAQALQEMRQSVSMLRSNCLAEKSLEAAIASLVEDFRATTPTTIEWTVDLPRPLPSELSSTVYRIVQAALTNIICHSNATEANLQLTAQSQTLYLLIKDNGQGFDPAQNSTGFGIEGMRERTLALDGQFSLFSEPGLGCLITAQIPLPKTLP